ncbi:uncharacterized protein HD556DRAFT_1440799 [Suillus plorans]|uniref:Uncharacterized protein n=1 Tax=Suillus plorans TaxID=116603 RepID=A0A9P7DLN3_9AGAM|nr:uncharacterized protein HD556DRAFT_1440799 [Suillus plorans]KAG1797840.1 hypothetical protein HD556DRAFT_1440799 [Suillus plorans]
MDCATTLIFQPDTGIPEFAGRGAQYFEIESIHEPAAVRENAKFSGTHSFLGNHVADYVLLNAFQFQDYGEKIKNIHSFQLLYALETTLGSTIGMNLSLGCPILPQDAREIKSPCLVAFGRRSHPGPYVQGYQKYISPFDTLSSPSPPSFECDYSNLGRAMAQHPTSACCEEKVSLPPPPRIAKPPLSPLTVGEGTLNNLKDEPDRLGPGSLLWKVPIGSQLQQPQPSTPDPFQVPQVPSHSHTITSPAHATLIPALGRDRLQQPQLSTPDPFQVPQVPSHSQTPTLDVGRPGVRDPRISRLIAAGESPSSFYSDSFNNITWIHKETHLSATLDTQYPLPAPTLASRAPTPFPGLQPPANLTLAGTNQLFPHIASYVCSPSSPTTSDSSSYHILRVPPNSCIDEVSAADFFVDSDGSSLFSDDDMSSTTSSDYSFESVNEDSCNDTTKRFNHLLPTCDPHLPLGDVLIAADRLAVGFTTMPTFISYLSFDPTSNALVADPPKYETNIRMPYKGVHCGREQRATLPFNGTYRISTVQSLNSTASLIYSDMAAHIKREVGPEQAKFLATRPPSIYHYNRSHYPGTVVRGQTRLENRYYEWRNLRRLHLDLISAVHATLTPEQSKDCNDADLCVIIVENDKALPAWVNRSAFFLQTAPFCNPFLTRHESTYLRSAASYFRFYGYEHTTNIIDHVLQLTVPDENVVYILLQHLLLDDLSRTGVKPLSSIGNILALHERKHREEFVIFQPGFASTFKDAQHYANSA